MAMFIIVQSFYAAAFSFCSVGYHTFSLSYEQSAREIKDYMKHEITEPNLFIQMW